MATHPLGLRTAGVVAVVALGVLGACGDGEPTPDEAFDPLATTIAPPDLDGPLPPVDAINAEGLFGDELAALGLRLTNRGGLIDRSGGGYVKSVNGDHYALYVEPISDDYSVDDYAANLLVLARLMGPELMDRYPDLASYDVCQEPPAGEVEDRYPPPATQIDLSRDLVESVDWENATHDDLFALRGEGGVVRVSPAIADVLGVDGGDTDATITTEAG